jgi:hypothetical protein
MVDIALGPQAVQFLALLKQYRVEYLLVGGVAVNFHGYHRPFQDLDVWIDRRPDNGRRMAQVLEACGGAPPRALEIFQTDQKVIRVGQAPLTVRPYVPGDRFINLGLPPYRAEVITWISGVTFDECYPPRVTGVINGVPVDLIGLGDLILNKRASVRMKDLDDLAKLQPPPRAEIDALTRRLLGELRGVLGERLVGLYLHGSLASGGFDPHSSDVDVLAVTNQVLPEALLAEIKSMHAHLAASGLKWADHMEVSYIPQAALRRFDPSDALFPALRIDGTFGVVNHGRDWIIERCILREYGVVIAGPPPKTLIDPVGPEDLRQAVAGILNEWWSLQLQDHSFLLTGEYQSFAILTMCRALYTLQHGAVVSKPAAARWAWEALGPPWASLIEQALAWRNGHDIDELDQTLDFIRFTLERSQQRLDGVEKP